MGTIIGVRSDIKHKSTLVEKISEEYEATWIKISNKNNINILVGNIYAPQESRTKRPVIKEMYSNIIKHIRESKGKGEKIIVTGDFNTKVGKYIKGNNKEVSKYGKELLKMLKREEMEVLNVNNKCEGMWTRIEGGTKSVIDYVIVNKEDTKYLNKMIIDENKLITPFHIVKDRTIYSDHCAITVKMNWYIASIKQNQQHTKIVNSKTLAEFKRKTSGKVLTIIAKGKGSIINKYTKWNKHIIKTMKSCFHKMKRKNYIKSRNIERLYGEKRKLKKDFTESRNKDITFTRTYRAQKKIINRRIEEEEKKIIKENINRNIREIEENGGLNSNAFWDFKKKMDSEKKKIEPITAMINEKGENETDIDKIKEIFKKFYTELFKPNIKENSSEETEAEQMQEIIFDSIVTIAKNEDKIKNKIKKKDIRSNINKLKNKNTCDTQGWSNKILLNSGIDIEDSLELLLNEIEEYEIIPNEWIELIIKSIYKGKGKITEVENRRGLFISNIISKLYEKIKLEQNNEKLNNEISKYQCGGKKGRSTVDHIMTLNAVIDYNRTINTETYILFADAYKCFDKLNLKNCIIDTYKIIGAKEAIKIYNLNKNGKAIIRTPVGEVGPIETKEIVRQGTILGPKLCCVNTDKVNEIGKKCITYIGPKIKTESLIYVDDIQNASSNVKQLENAVDNLNRLENKKGYLFNNDKNKTAILIVDKKKNKTYDIKLNIRKGEIKLTNDYKYLGEWYNEKGDHITSLKKRKEKINYYIKQIKNYGNEYKLGKYALMTRIKIYKTVVFPSIFHNIETWSRITKKEIKELESIQAKIIKKICGQRVTTPYFGILSELGMWPVEQHIEYKRIMLLHNILTTKGERLIKEIIEDQVDNTWKGCWMEQTKEICQKYNIDINNMVKLTKDNLKKVTKSKIKRELVEAMKVLIMEKTKLRWLNEFTQQEYIEQLDFCDSIDMIKIRLNMIETKCNYKGLFKQNVMCDICKITEDTTEHLLQCKETKNEVTTTIEDIKQANNEVVKQIREVLNRREELGFKINIEGNEGSDSDDSDKDE